MNKIVRKILKGVSLTSVLFVFQACYGTPQDMEQDNHIEGIVKARATGQPVKGIKVNTGIQGHEATTGDDGSFSVYVPLADSYAMKFEDADIAANGAYRSYDTVVANIPGYVYLNILLDTQ